MPSRQVAIGNQLRRIRRQLKISRQGMADSIGIPLDSYYKIEAGDRKIYISELLLLHRRHGITPNDILLHPLHRAHFEAINAQQPPRIIMRAIVTRYLRLTPELRRVIALLIDSLCQAAIERGEIHPDDLK